MNTILLILGVLSLGAVLIAAYVFTVAARNYVSDTAETGDTFIESDEATRGFVERSNSDRRQNDNIIEFPITLSSGEVVYRDRRTSDRRAAS